LDKLVRSFGSDVLVEDCSAGVILRDARTHFLIDKKVTLTLIMPADAVHGPVVTFDFLVFTTDYDLVIGINDIIDHFLPLLWDALGGNRLTEFGSVNALVDEISTGELVNPFPNFWTGTSILSRRKVTPYTSIIRQLR
jgi:hypothetical protein